MEKYPNQYGFTANAKKFFEYISRNEFKSINEVMKSTGLDLDQIKLAMDEVENRIGR